MAAEIRIKEGNVYGGWRRPVNGAAVATTRNTGVIGSIHDDATAQRLGLRGGTVAGSIHLELFPPLMIEAFGQCWFEQGSISMYFVDPTTNMEEVRAVIKAPPEGATDVQVDAWIERPDGRAVAQGTAAIGSPDALSALRARPLDRYESEEPRILAGLKPGDELPKVNVVVTREDIERRMKVISDPLDWYQGDSPWGSPIATPATMVRILAMPSNTFLGARRQTAVGLFGAIELRNVNGPVRVDEPYKAGGNIVYVGTSPKTEYMWYDSYIDDKNGIRVAEMRMMLRYMKASSALYKEK